MSARSDPGVDVDNPFDSDGGDFVVIVNSDGQHSLWPGFHAVPTSWTVAFGPAGRDACLEHVRENWTDMRPRTVVEHLAGSR